MGSPRHIINVQNDRKDDKDVSKNFPYFDIYGPDVHTFSLSLSLPFGFLSFLLFKSSWVFYLDMVLEFLTSGFVSCCILCLGYDLDCSPFFLDMVSIKMSTVSVAFNFRRDFVFYGFSVSILFGEAKHFPAVKRVLCLLCRPEECGF